MIVDTKDWGVISVRGADRVRFLQGLTTVNVQALTSLRWGAILNPKGRTLSLIAMEAHGDEIWVRCQGALVEKTHQILDRYAVMDEVEFAVARPPSHRLWDGPGDVWTAPFLAGEAPATAGGGATEAAVEELRIRGGFLAYGRDLDEDCFPFETPLAGFLDYEKGCYVGQEPVFRVHSQGNTARSLRGFTIAGDEDVAAGAPISHPAKDRAGAITSAVRTPAGQWIALGYLHRTAWEGGAVTVAGRAAEVHALPF
jgi:folate-binding protein YgfZ